MGRISGHHYDDLQLKVIYLQILILNCSIVFSDEIFKVFKHLRKKLCEVIEKFSWRSIEVLRIGFESQLKAISCIFFLAFYHFFLNMKKTKKKYKFDNVSLNLNFERDFNEAFWNNCEEK